MDSLNQKIMQLHSVMTESQRRYTFLLLAVAASAAALSLKNTEDQLLNWQLIPIGCAMIFWGLSFHKGLQRLTLVESCLIMNIKCLDYEREYMQTTPVPKNRVDHHKKMVRQIDDENVKSVKAATWQLRFLLYGVLSYAAWHVLRLYVNTFCP